MSRWSRARALAGVLCKDWWRYERALRAPHPAYLGICNRTERLEAAPDGSGYRCDWRWTSDLHAPQYLPGLGQRLMRRALSDHPINRSGTVPAQAGTPQVSFVIGHRGNARLPHLLATIETIAAQRGAVVECIVVEQDVEPTASAHLPPWVHHVHTPPPVANMPYCRSWAFNTGALHARSDVLVLHDNDLLIPVDYAAAALKHVGAGCDVANLKRFIFYLTQDQTARVASGKPDLSDLSPLSIMQNAQGGGSIAITRAAYGRIGGMDETFVGWGGEDNEFWERACTLNVWPYSYLPLVHLWHPAHEEKNAPGNPAQAHYDTLSRIPATDRIAQLRERARGEMSGPASWPVEAA